MFFFLIYGIGLAEDCYLTFVVDFNFCVRVFPLNGPYFGKQLFSFGLYPVD